MSSHASSVALLGAIAVVTSASAQQQVAGFDGTTNTLFGEGGAPATAITSSASYTQQLYNEPLGVHGSGSTTASKCLWQIMATFEEQIKLPVKLTYRAVGSATGIKEFLGEDDIVDPESDVGALGKSSFVAHSDFGVADVPISSEDRNTWFANGAEFVQLPFVLSTTSFFHNVPGVHLGNWGLNLTGCMLARIFNGDITAWDHNDILEVNPEMNVPANYPIVVARRDLGSTSTRSITTYLHAGCPQTQGNPNGWPSDKVGSRINWDPSTMACEGSDKVAACIRDNEGAIGYLDSARGYEEGLTELRVQNGDGRFLTVQEAGYEGVQAAAADSSLVPGSADGDFSKTSFFNQPGPQTWPMATVSYVFLRKDLSSIPDPTRRTLLKAFVAALFDPDYIRPCSDRYGLVPVADDLRSLSLGGLDMLQLDADVDQEWVFEKSTMVGAGQGDRVISERRTGYASLEARRLADEVERLNSELARTNARMDSELGDMRARIESLLELIDLNGGATTVSDVGDSTADAADVDVVEDDPEPTGDEVGDPAVAPATAMTESVDDTITIIVETEVVAANATTSSTTKPGSTATLATTQPATTAISTKQANLFPEDDVEEPYEELLFASSAFFPSNLMVTTAAAAGWMLFAYL